MSVVQRCPNCGTTKATSGECEACHEATVRYFCTNHTPGLWLDAGTCPQCGARFGDPARRTSAPAPALPVRKRPPAPARAPAAISVPPPAYARAVPPKDSADVWISPERLPPAREEELEAGASRTALWQKLLQAALRAREMRVRAAPDPDKPPIGRSAGGCLMRLVLFIVLLFVALAGAAFMFGRALLGF